MVKEIELDGSHGPDGNKKTIRLSFAVTTIAAYATWKD